MARYALVVGITQYDYFRKLPKAATDAEAIASLLQQHHYHVTRLPRQWVGENQGAIAPDKRLTATELAKELKLFLNERAQHQDVVIYFAGHGFQVKNLVTDEDIGYLATSDSTKDGQNAIRFEDFNTLMGRAELASLVTLMDCCHAGSLIEQQTLLEPVRATIQQKARSELIAACRDFERAREGEKHGIFTAAVLSGLSSQNASHGKVTSTDLFRFVSRELERSGQEVIHAANGADIPLVTYAAADQEQQSQTASADPLARAIELIQNDFELLDQHFFERLQRNPGRSHILKLPAATWSLVLQGNYVERDQQWDALKLAQQLAQTQGTSLLLIRGEPGAGKTALMRWLAYSLFLEGGLILQKTPQDTPGWLSQLQELTEVISDQSVYVIVDDLFRDESLLAELEQNEFLPNLTIIGTTRLSESRHERLEELEYEVRCLDLNRPSDAEKHRVLEKVCQDEQIRARVEQMSVAERQQLMESPIMLVLMLQLSEGKTFNRIIADIIKCLPNSEHRPTYQVFGVICSFFQYGSITPPEIIELCVPQFKQARRLVMADLEGLTGTDRWSGYEGFTTIHELIARTAMDVSEKPVSDQENLLYSWIDSPSLLERNLRAAIAQISSEEEIHQYWTCWILTRLTRVGQNQLVRQVLADYPNQIANLEVRIFGLWALIEIYRSVGLPSQSSRCSALILETTPHDSWEWTLWLSRISKSGTAEQKRAAIAQTMAWLESHSDDYHVRERYLALVGTFGTPEQKQAAIAHTQTWLDAHPDDTTVRQRYLALMGLFGSPEQKQAVIAQTQNWLESHPHDTYVRTKYLAFMGTVGTPAQKQAAIAQAQIWLESYLDDTAVRTKYLALIGTYGTPAQKQAAIAQTRTWLESHPNDTYVRTKYLALIDTFGTAEQKQAAIAQAQLWLESHPDATSVRIKYLVLIGIYGTPAQKQAAIAQTQIWLDAHPNSAKVRTQYLALISTFGTPEQKQTAIAQTQTWLDDHSDDVEVRTKYLALMDTFGTAEQKRDVMVQAQTWLESHPDDTSVRTKHLALIGTYGTVEQKQAAIAQTQSWLESHPDDTTVRTQYLALIGTANLDDERLKLAIQAQKIWIGEQQTISQDLWTALLPVLYHHSKFIFFKDLIKQALAQYPEDPILATVIFGYFRDELEYEICYRLADLIGSSRLPPVQWNHCIDAANFFRDYGELERAEEIYQRTLKSAQYLTKNEKSFQREVDYASISYARLLLLQSPPNSYRATQLIQPILAKASKHAVCHWIMAQCYQAKGRSFYQHAIASFGKAVQFDRKKEGFFWHQFGRFYRDSLGDISQARSCFEKALRQKVTLSACIDMAELEFDAGHLSKAGYYLQKGLELVPANRIEREEREKLSDRIQFLQIQLGM